MQTEVGLKLSSDYCSFRVSAFGDGLGVHNVGCVILDYEAFCDRQLLATAGDVINRSVYRYPEGMWSSFRSP